VVRLAFRSVLCCATLPRKAPAGLQILHRSEMQPALGQCDVDRNLSSNNQSSKFAVMDWLIAAQGWLYGGLAETMRSASDLNSLAYLMVMAFVFGIIHALMPGHGKSVLVSYHLGRRTRLIEGIATGFLLASTHVGIAVVFVLAGVAVISRSLADAGRAPAFHTFSATLIVSLGAYLLLRAVWPHPHRHARDGRILAIATGLVPCPLTTFILTYALARGKLVMGLAAVGGMLVGVIVTICSFAVGAIVMRQEFLTLLVRTEALRFRFGWWMELFGALGVLVLGLAMLTTA
jgi:nickel/cobalt transporter (NicO) family protein